MWTHPGKKLLFMGCEFGQKTEWNHDASLQWELLADAGHRGVQQLVRDLNRIHVTEPALHDSDDDAAGFTWLIGDDSANSVFAYLRHSVRDGNAPPVLVVCNFTPVARHGYRVGAPPRNGNKRVMWREVLNTDSQYYGGGNLGNCGGVISEAFGSHGQPASIVLTLPPLSVQVFRREG
jgi:1,4-alpha-glucan branching enzyme